jgi:5-methylcytosine-specific restriction endonuclease McrA
MTTPSEVKNAIRRCLRGIVDPYPSRTRWKLVWEHFESCCAYCGRPIDRMLREGHRDHLVSHKDGGGSDLGNFVLACRECNGDEKRDENWVVFLKRKNPNARAFRERKAKIEDWIARNLAQRRVVSEETREAVAVAAAKVSAALDKAVAEIRDLKKRQMAKDCR